MVLHELHACEEEQEHEAQVGEEVDVVVDLREVEPFRADQDPEQDLEHDRGQDEAPVEPGQDRAGARRGEHQDEGADVRRRLDGERDERGHAAIVGVSPQVPANESPGREPRQPVAAIEGVGRAGHRLDGDGRAGRRGADRVAGEDLDVGCRLGRGRG